MNACFQCRGAKKPQAVKNRRLTDKKYEGKKILGNPKKTEQKFFSLNYKEIQL